MLSHKLAEMLLASPNVELRQQEVNIIKFLTDAEFVQNANLKAQSMLAREKDRLEKEVVQMERVTQYSVKRNADGLLDTDSLATVIRFYCAVCLTAEN